MPSPASSIASNKESSQSSSSKNVINVTFYPEEHTFVKWLLLRDPKHRPTTKEKLLNSLKNFIKTAEINKEQTLKKLINAGYVKCNTEEKSVSYDFSHYSSEQTLNSAVIFDNEELKVLMRLKKNTPTTKDKFITCINNSTSKKIDKKVFLQKLIGHKYVTFDENNKAILNQALFKLV